MSQESRNPSQVYSLLISSLVLLSLSLCIGAFLLVLLIHPEWFPEKEKLEEAEAKNSLSLPSAPQPLADVEGEVVDGIDVSSGFVAEGAYKMVKMHCTACHSSKLVLQNRASREGWEDMIRWMQRTQKLWDLGEQEGPILDYLSTYYSPVKKGRRVALEIEEWYEIP